MVFSAKEVLTGILSICIFFLGWQLRNFSKTVESLKKDLDKMYEILIRHISDHTIHKEGRSDDE